MELKEREYGTIQAHVKENVAREEGYRKEIQGKIKGKKEKLSRNCERK